MVLDKQGGPNWFKNWCTAPVIVDVESDEVYFTPLYYTMAHFSKYIRPGATRIAVTCADKEMMVTAAQNTDGSIVLIVFNPTQQSKNIELNLQQQQVPFQISAQAIQTILL
jgi:glucosylceramidase